MPSNTTRIAKNTIALYFRQILGMLIGLYTVRVVLSTLGVIDYGIYNVVAGFVSMLTFLRVSLAQASQRYFSFELGRKDFERLQQIFSLSCIIYFLIAALVVVLAETIGLWFLNTRLVIPVERIGAAKWIYQTALLSLVLNFIAAPYMASLMAHENMKIYAYIGIVEALLKLAIVYILGLFPVDKLKLYGILLFVVAFVNQGIYIIRNRSRGYWENIDEFTSHLTTRADRYRQQYRR
jgi:O-antigen/teichoic acid export membrane protein